METKICKKCGKEKLKTDFYSCKFSKDKLAYYCKECFLNKCREYRKNNPEKIKNVNRICYLNKREQRIKKQKQYSLENKDRIKAYRKEWLKRKPDYSKRNDLKRKYNLELEEFDKMMQGQGNSCLTCGKLFKKRSDAHVDHCHKTQKVRGLLCSHCNTAIGLVYEKEETLQNMINYLRQNG